jgi:hypothetical protein
MAAPFTRASLSRGPAFLTWNGGTLFPVDNVIPKHGPEFDPVKSSLTGQIDKAKKNLVIKHSLKVFGLWDTTTLGVLFPSWLMNPVPGTSVFGTTDLPLVYQARNGDKITYANTQITKLVNLHLGVEKETFEAELELTSLIANGANPEDTAAYFTRATGTYSAPAALVLTNFLKARWTAAFGLVSGLASFVGQKGFDVSWTADLKAVEVEGWGTVDMTVGEGGMIAQCKTIPIGPTGAQIDTAQAVTAAQGTLLSAGSATLTLTGGTHSVVLNGAAILESATQFGIEPLRVGEIVFETTRALTAGALGAVASVG